MSEEDQRKLLRRLRTLSFENALTVLRFSIAGAEAQGYNRAILEVKEKLREKKDGTKSS